MLVLVRVLSDGLALLFAALCLRLAVERQMWAHRFGGLPPELWRIWLLVFVHLALVAWGTARIRPREGRGVEFAGLLAAVAVQGAVYAWIVWPGTGFPGAGWLLHCVLLAPVMVLGFAWFARRGAVLAAGELVILFLFAWVIATGRHMD